MTKLYDELCVNGKIRKVVAALEQGERVNLSNVKIGLKHFLTAIQFNVSRKNILYLTYSDREAQKQAEALAELLPDQVCYFPLEPVHAYFADARSQEITKGRMQVIQRLLSKETCIVVTSVDSLLKKMMPPERLKEKFFTLTAGETIDIEILTSRLIQAGYERVYQAESPGQFARRGGIVDVYSLTAELPVRIEFFDDEIESIRYYDAETQLSREETEKTEIVPACEIILADEERDEVLKIIRKTYADDHLFDELAEQFNEERGEHDESLFTFLKEKATLLDYIGSFIGIYDEYARIKETYDIFTKKTFADYETLIGQGYALPEEKDRFVSFGTIEKFFDATSQLRLSLFSNQGKKGLSMDMDARDLESFAGQFPLFLDFLKRRIDLGYSIHICCKTPKTAETVKQQLTDVDIFAFSEEGAGVHFEVGEIAEGFEMPEEMLVYINESEIFKERRVTKRRPKKYKGRKIDSFAELHIGDYVVHDVLGIGIYKGIEQMTIDGHTRVLMVIEYQKEAKLYIPVEQMDSVQVYIGTGGDKLPKINEMGNPDWQKAKNKAKKAVEDMADELIALYAKRRAMKGYAFGPDTNWQREFEEAFPYEETDDQLRCVEEIKADMESETPMDRLLCGDVGYGKTEVALRAAFKAVMEGKQVAVLVPTTILAQQHYNTIRERFKQYPVEIDMLSRFRTSTQQKKTIADLKAGRVDLIIGTHRLLSKDVSFHDLGLLIIDEEQRFGVRSKEKIKQLKENIDVLTLSATPIPRTLHMSMTGVRDMSVIEEPPTGRRPVQTYVMPYNPLIIQDAINRELARGGQVYYVHNRVHNIQETALEIKRLVPDARVVVAHGQMSGNELEDIMADFLNHEFDVLVATTIVESGIDVKNANTMIIDDGDRFGLSQLYQLRGRVGRSSVQAYAYVTHHKGVLSEVAQKRLKAIKDFTAFGSGFKVAMRDLEIRGAGNLLGAEQSGHLFRIGYELYCRILEEAIAKRLGGKTETKTEMPIRINLDVSGYIPANYIESEELKYDIYKKLTYIRTLEDYDELEAELIDRFGDIPTGVYNLMAIAMIKNTAREFGIKEIRQRDQQIFITYGDTEKMPVPTAEEIGYLSKKYGLKFSAGRDDSDPCWSIQIKGTRDRQILGQLNGFLEKLRD